MRQRRQRKKHHNHAVARNLQTRGFRVLVVDADESNFGLSAQLGLAAPKELMEQLGGKKAVQGKMGKYQGDGHKAPVLGDFWSISNIPKGTVSGGDGLFLVQVGKVKHYGEGCACPMGVLARDFLDHLKLCEKDVVVWIQRRVWSTWAGEWREAWIWFWQ